MENVRAPEIVAAPVNAKLLNALAQLQIEARPITIVNGGVDVEGVVMRSADAAKLLDMLHFAGGEMRKLTRDNKEATSIAVARRTKVEKHIALSKAALKRVSEVRELARVLRRLVDNALAATDVNARLKVIGEANSTMAKVDAVVRS